MRAIKILCSIMIFIIIIGCENKKPNVETVEKNSQRLIQKDSAYEPVEFELAKQMESAFMNNTYNVLFKLNMIKDREFVLSKNEWLNMCDFLSKNKQTTTIRMYFVQYNQDKFVTQKYAVLEPYNGKLYIVLGYFDNKQTLINNKYYGVFSINKTLEIDPKDLDLMHKDYKDNIKPHINQLATTKNNTDYIKIETTDFNNQISLINKHNGSSGAVKVKCLRFKLAEVQNPSPLKSVKSRRYYVKKYKNQTGQLTTLTDVEDVNGQKITSLSNYDMNTLCPPNCP
ncbi:MAG: hypothetical protein ABI554_11745 [Flavobacterium sp.]